MTDYVLAVGVILGGFLVALDVWGTAALRRRRIEQTRRRLEF